MPIPILKADAEKISFIRNEAAKSDSVLVVDFTDAAQSTKTYDDYAALLESRTADQLRYLGHQIPDDPGLSGGETRRYPPRRAPEARHDFLRDLRGVAMLARVAHRSWLTVAHRL